MTIRPQTSATRSAHALDGLWSLRFDLDDIGVAERWAGGLDPAASHAVAVPGSWNEQLAEIGGMNFVGVGWYETMLDLPPLPPGRERLLRFGGVTERASVWLDGVAAEESGPAMLPFELPLGDRTGRVRLTVAVDGRLPADGPTQAIGLADYRAEGRMRDEYFPAVRFDFFPFAGIHRSVHIVERPVGGIASVRLRLRRDGLGARVEVGDAATVRLAVGGVTVEAPVVAGVAEIDCPVPGVRAWSPDDPALYDLTIAALDGTGTMRDVIAERIGFRDVAIVGTQLLLNGAPIALRGFGKHEDSPQHGRGLNLPQLVRDFQLMRWCGANSVRTAHYPYAEEFYDLADAHGILVIDEVYSINLDFRRVGPATLAAHQAAVTALIERDANRTCVIAWSLANEPGYLGEAAYRETSAPYWRDLFAHARALDPTRPLLHANVEFAGDDDPAFAEADIIALNRYFGWYAEPGQLDRAVARLRATLDGAARHGKPVFLSEFGADAVAGEHAISDQLFTEEYQARLLLAYWDELVRHPAVVGGHVWNFADFRTAQHGRRVVHNRKGVFTRTREPKAAAFALREAWTGRRPWDRP